MPAQPRQRPRPRLLTTGGLKGWQYGVLVASCVGSMLAGASVVHTYYRPDLSLPDTGEGASDERNTDVGRDTAQQ